MNSFDTSLLELIQKSQPYLLALVMCFARIMAVVQIFPLFTITNVRGVIRATFAIVLTIPIIPLVAADVSALKDPPIYMLGLMVAKEFLIGTLMGSLFAIPFWGVQAAGDIIDFQRSASAANLSDPVNASEQSLTGVIMLYASLAIFVMIGGIPTLVAMIYESFKVYSVVKMLPQPDMELVKSLGFLLGRMFIIGIVVAGPIIIVDTVLDLTLVFAARTSKQVPVYDFSILLKNMVVAAFIPLYAIFLSQYIVGDWRSLMIFIRGFLRIENLG